jgi:hypothetical protein
MRKYFFNIVAVIIAIGTFAFTEYEKKAQVDMYVFEFDGTQSGGYSVGNVEDESNTYWKYKGKNLALCNNTDDKACRVRVPAAYVDDINAPTELSGITISATLSGSTAHVTAISGTSTQYSNQPD